MFVVVLRFADDGRAAGELMDGHNAWLARGFDDGVFLLAGGIRPGAGGVVLARDVPAEELRLRVESDPFVAEGVVRAEIIDVAPGRVDERLAALLDAGRAA